ncbi:MAG: ribose-phosphate diphosphokinase [Deltaproteobacteria bacterium]|nr:ribose-phosphate diphosphokinase [Deltaproteobacteria bacterium]
MIDRDGGSLHFFPDSAAIARDIARRAGLRECPIALHRFPDNETLVRITEPCGQHAVLFAQIHDPDAKLFPLLLAANALRSSGVEQLTLLTPYLPYMRQDIAFRAGEAVSQHVIAKLIGEAVDEFITLEPHLHRIEGLEEVFPCSARALDAAPLLADWCTHDSDDALLVGPDAESEAWVRNLADLGSLPWIVCHKQRLGDDRVRVTLPDPPQPPRTRRAILVDDIASSGTTLAAAAIALRAAGIETVDAVVVHAIFAPGAMARIRGAGIRRLVSCDTIPHETNSIATAHFFADALRTDGDAARDRKASACSG